MVPNADAEMEGKIENKIRMMRTNSSGAFTIFQIFL
jgi:hypothetical protein